MNTLIGSIIVFMLVITLHELGHFSVAKMVGIKVNEFSIGMGPKIFQKEGLETKYSIRILPIGGYVAMEGEDERSDDPRSFNNVNVFKRMAVVVAGVCMNFILAVIAFFIVAVIVGTPTNTIGSIVDNSSAYHAGLYAGDKIIEINDIPTKNWEDIVFNISNSKENSDIRIKITRNHNELVKHVIAKSNNGRIQIGITPNYEKSISNAIKYSFLDTIQVIKDVFMTIKLLFKGNVDVTMLSGPVGVISVIGQATSLGMVYLLKMIGIISANLGVVNLLPIPALDGGKLLFLIIEKLIGKKINEKIENTLSLIGISFLLFLMLYITLFGDLARMNLWNVIKK
ncbi:MULTISPECIES: RIP metalloprotease RseP [Peptoniphilus]|uniref:RIP metalloprotease RseP n=1 Tax=Peptoniphilus TaxID=162289 RepID=UPI0001DA9CE6|nr:MULTISPECIES: RIP metalloprotease RseP [Peptoniphilus]EFI42266.1 RIP metalloprotease RseP [Peptoniphilus sp. oral taxon 386 str. F0131]